MNLDSSLESLKGVGPIVASKLKMLGLYTVFDLIEFFPRRYDDYSQISPVIRLRPGTAVCIKAVVKHAKGRYVRRGMHITEALASDESGSVKLIWFNQPYRENGIKLGAEYFITGNFELSRGRLNIMNPSMELVSDFPINTARIIPVYKQTKGLKSSAIRKILAQIKPNIDELPEILPKSVISDNKLLSRALALSLIHFPNKQTDVNLAKKRLSFEELFGISIASLLNKKQFSKESGVLIKFDESTAKNFTASLPYDLTNAQRKAVWQIYKDFESKTPMNRLVEGDVGSGKTVVAVMASVMAMEAGYQVAFMAPTELLARQHAESISKLLAGTEFSNKVGLLVSSVKAPAKKIIYEKIKNGDIKLIVGTHALITDKVDLHNLGFVIIDEQHRFGVNQRKTLQSKAKKMPHVLSMTATPIPRSLALTLYGELDVTILDEMPPGRTPVKTKIVSPNSKDQMYSSVKEHIERGNQTFVVCPLIEESDVLKVLSAEKVYEDLSKKIFKEYRVALLHGKQKPDEKDKTMSEFVAGKIDILVSTTVVEVGVDVPNATVMIVEGVERFGLAQVHQLRGRVGRGKDAGFCYLVMSDSSEPTRRLRALESTSDGFKLAELDLEIRGPGAIYGHMQSGQLDLRIANLTDLRQIAGIRKSAQDFLDSSEDIKKYPELNKRVQKYRSVTNLN